MDLTDAEVERLNGLSDEVIGARSDSDDPNWTSDSREGSAR